MCVIVNNTYEKVTTISSPSEGFVCVFHEDNF